MTDVFQRVRDTVSAEDAARLYGADFDRLGRAVCPFHDDKHPSMTFRGGRFRCWACGASGDAVDYTARLYGLDPMEALRRLNEDFRLALPLDRPASKKEREQARRRRELADLKQQYNEWRDGMLSQLCAAFRTGHIALKGNAALTDGEAQAVYWMAALEYWAEQLGNGDMAAQMAIFRNREGVERLCERILRNTRQRSKTA